jgi:hypothetical protein
MNRNARWMLVAVLVGSTVGSWVALPNVFADSPRPEQARFGIADVVFHEQYQEELELVPEQMEEIAKLRDAHLSSRLVNPSTTLGLPDWASERVPFFLDPPTTDSETMVKYQALVATVERELREILLPSQLETAYTLVLRTRFTVGGLRALVESTDVPLIKQANLTTPAARVQSIFDAAEAATKEEIEPLQAILVSTHDQYEAAASRVRQKHFERAISELGEDGQQLLGFAASLGLDAMSNHAFAPDQEQALGVGFVSVITDREHRNALSLTREQIIAIEALRKEYSPISNAYLRDVLGVREGEAVHLRSIEEAMALSARFTLEVKATQKAMGDAHVEQLMRVLLPEQIEIAYQLVLQGRFERRGLKAFAESTDVPLINEAGLAGSADKVLRTLNAAETAATEELKELKNKLHAANVEYHEAVRKVQKRHLDQALMELGEDGNRILEIVRAIGVKR